MRDNQTNILDELEALANSIPDSDDSDSNSGDDDDNSEEDHSPSPKPFVGCTESGVEEEILHSSVSENIADNDADLESEIEVKTEAIVSVNVEGVNPENVMISEGDLRDITVSSLPSVESDLKDASLVSIDSNTLPSMSSLQDIFKSIASKQDLENVGQEVSQEIDVDVNVIENVDNRQMNQEQKEFSLFSDYSIDEIIQNKQNDDEEDEEEEDVDQDADEESDESSDEEELENDYDSLNDLCDNYIDHLNQMLLMLQKELERNIARQSQIDAEISDVNLANSLRAQQSKNQHKIISRKPLTIFAAPYFKDKSLFGPPPNEDTKKKRLNKELDVWIEFPKPFTEDERKKLKQYVKEDAIRIKSLRYSKEKENLEEKLNDFQFDEQLKEAMYSQLYSCNRQIDDIRKLPDEQLFDNRYEEYDWEKISVTNFKSVHSPKECQLQWQNLVHPSINRSVFSPEEDKLLKRLAEALHGQDWDSIAREMETGRTPHQCFSRYMTRHNVVINNRKWEKSEDDRMRRLIAHCRINNFIPWTKVAYYMERRTKDQCYQRYVYSLKDNIRKGPFSEAEDMLLIIGESLYKKDWAKINEMIPCRTPIQLHCRWNHFLRCDHKQWTEDEDLALLEQVRKHGLRDWVLVCQELGGDRTRSQCRQRFQFIYKCFKKNPALALGNIDYKEDIAISKKRQEEVHDRLSDRFEEWKAGEIQLGLYDNVTDDNPALPHIELPNGEILKRKSAARFIAYLQEFLPKQAEPKPLPPLENKATRTLPKHEEEIFKAPIPSSTQGRKQKQKKLKITGYDHKKFKRYRGKKKEKNVPNKEKLGSFKTMIDRNISKFFRPTWILRNNKINTASYRYSQKDMDMLTSAGLGLGKILKMKRISVPEEDEDDYYDKNRMLLKNFCRQQVQLNQSLSASTAVSSPKVQRTYGKTYSRKPLKQSNSRAATPSNPDMNNVESNKDKIDLVPPSVATLIGFRGVLLTNSYLADPVNHLETMKKEKDNVDETVQQGVNNPEVLNAQEPEIQCLNDSHLAADQLLVKRFIQMFLWPAKMSSIPPLKQENLFSDSEDEELLFYENN